MRVQDCAERFRTPHGSPLCGAEPRCSAVAAYLIMRFDQRGCGTAACRVGHIAELLRIGGVGRSRKAEAFRIGAEATE